MNNERRKKLRHVIELLDTADMSLNTVLEQEEDCLYNIPESFQDTDRYIKMEDCISKIEDAIEGIEYVRNSITDASM